MERMKKIANEVVRKEIEALENAPDEATIGDFKAERGGLIFYLYQSNKKIGVITPRSLTMAPIVELNIKQLNDLMDLTKHLGLPL